MAHNDNGTQANGILSRPVRLLTIGLVLTIAGTAFEALAVATIMPLTTSDLGGLALYGWAFSAFMLTNLIGITIAGAEADRSGPARPFVLGVALFTLGLLVAGAAPNMPLVIVGRAIQGFGAGFISSVAYASIGRAYGPEAKPRMLAVLSSAWVIPGLIGPALAGLVADQVGWRWVFLGLAPLPPIAASMALPALRRLDRVSAAARDWAHTRAAVQLALGVGLLMGGIGLAGQPLAAVALAAAGAALSWPALRRLLPAGTLRAAPGMPAAIATMGLLNLAFFGVDAFIPLALTSIRGQSATVAGLALTAATITWTTGAWVQAHYATSQGRRRMVTIGLVLIAAGVAGSIAVLAPSVPVLFAPLAWGVAGLGIGIAFSTISLVVLESAPTGQEGTASAAMQLANVLGIALGTGLGGAIVGQSSSAGSASPLGLATHDLLMIGVIGLAVLAASRMPDRPAERPAPETPVEERVPDLAHT